jgi:phosphoribosylformylglycinamidine (FGAM) synthase-like enzyme
MCIGGRLGLALTLDTNDALTALFSESNGRLLVEVPPEHCAGFETLLAGLPLARVGMVTGGQRLTVSTRTTSLITLPVEQLVAAWQSLIPNS